MAEYTSDTSHPAIPVTWTDDPLVADETFIKKVHLIELRDSLEAMDGHYHIFKSVDSTDNKPSVNVNWFTPDTNIYVDETFIDIDHFQEVIDFQKDFEGHYHTCDIGYGEVPGGPFDSSTYSPSFTFEDDPLVTDVTWIKASAINELRAHQYDMSIHTHTVDCTCECTCTCTCTCQCTCTCRCKCDWF